MMMQQERDRRSKRTKIFKLTGGKRTADWVQHCLCTHRMAMIQPVLLLLLLAARFSPVFGTEISVLEGTSVTLVCRFPSEENHILYTTLSETSPCKWWSCFNPIAVTTIPTIAQENNYRCITGVEMVNFTILNLQPADSGNYCCRAAISTVLNKPSEFYSLRVVKGHTGCNRDLLDGLEFLGNDIENQPITIQSASQCRQECTNIYKCQYFTFSWKETEMRNKCSLKASTGDLLNSRITIQRLQNATSGYSLKNCSGKVTYSAKKYSLVLKWKNWTEAQEYCRQHYTNLSIIHTEEDWKAIQSTLSHFSGDVWIGLNGNGPVQTKKWSWSDGEELMFLNWDGGFGSVLNIHCAVSVSSRFRQQLCNTSLPYMCQYVRHVNGVTEKVYKLIIEPKNQEEAVKDCKDQQEELASICNQKEQDAFDELNKGITWIGLKHENNTWNWSSGEPFQKWDNPMRLGDGNCVKLNSENDRKWTPENCSTRSPFLCYGVERPLNNTTGDLTTPVAPETTFPTSTGPPSTKTSTTTPTTLLPTTTNGQSTTSPTTTTNGQSTTSPTTTTNGQSITSPTTTTNGQSTTSPTTNTTGQSTTSPTTTTTGQSTTSPTTTTTGQSTTSPTTTTNGQSTTSPTTTTNGQSTTSPTTATTGQSNTSPTTATTGQSTTSPTTATTGQSTTSPTTATTGQSTTSPTTTTNGQSTTSPTTTNNGQSTISPTTTTNVQSTTSPNTTTNAQSTTSPNTTTNAQSTTSPTTTTNAQSTTSPTTTTTGQSTTSPPTTTNGQSTTSP
ncbi:mucin-4-like, partial [Oncorhynchus keta]|uniref:mucin-4-like n=1 Tax=Oncorhynchus keta TaxID=8018 RepID=UPI00227ABD00